MSIGKACTLQACGPQSDSQDQYEKLSMLGSLCNPRTMEAETGRPLRFAGKASWPTWQVPNQ